MPRINRAARLTAALFLPYLAGSSLTFGYIWNHVDKNASVLGAILWPFYWVFRIGIELTKGWTF